MLTLMQGVLLMHQSNQSVCAKAIFSQSEIRLEKRSSLGIRLELK